MENIFKPEVFSAICYGSIASFAIGGLALHEILRTRLPKKEKAGRSLKQTIKRFFPKGKR